MTFIAGIATGKTTAVAASYLIDCITTPYFRALNTSVTAKQAELPFEMVQGWIEGNPRLEHLIDNINLRPYPTITFKNRSEWIFRTAGKDARFIRGLEFDRINYDEAGLDHDRRDGQGAARSSARQPPERAKPHGPPGCDHLAHRLPPGWRSASTAAGRKTPKRDLENFLSLRVSTYMNTKLTAQMIHLMEAEYSDDMIDVELKGMFPDYGLSMFPRTHIAGLHRPVAERRGGAGPPPRGRGRPKTGLGGGGAPALWDRQIRDARRPRGDLHHGRRPGHGQPAAPQRRDRGGDGRIPEKPDQDRLLRLGGRQGLLQPVPVLLQVRDCQVPPGPARDGHHRDAESH